MIKTIILSMGLAASSLSLDARAQDERAYTDGPVTVVEDEVGEKMVTREHQRASHECVESSHSLEKGAATIDMHSKGVQVLLHRHSCAAAEFLRISAQQFHAVFVEPLGALDDAAQMFCMGQSIETLEVLSSEAGDNRSPIVIAENSLVYHSRFPRGGFKQHRLLMLVSWGAPDKYKNGRYALAARNVDAGQPL